jgi:hypothetical protein
MSLTISPISVVAQATLLPLHSTQAATIQAIRSLDIMVSTAEFARVVIFGDHLHGAKGLDSPNPVQDPGQGATGIRATNAAEAIPSLSLVSALALHLAPHPKMKSVYTAQVYNTQFP